MKVNQVVKTIERHYNISIKKIEETEIDDFKVELFNGGNYYSENQSGDILKLNLSLNAIEDIGILLKTSHSLTHLNLSKNNISNIKILSKFKRLKFLDLSTNAISDFVSISNLKNLENLYLDDNSITSVPVLNLQRLSELWLYNNQINDISNLSNLSNLTLLDLSFNKITDLKPLLNIQNLLNLTVNNNDLKNVDGLENLSKIYFISLSGNKIRDISNFSKIEKLTYLNLSDNIIENIIPLRNIELEELFISNNLVYDLSPLYNSLKNKKIKFINISGNPLIYPPSKVAMIGELQIVQWFDAITMKANIKIEQAIKNESPKLDLSYMGLTDLSLIPKLFECEKLIELILSNHYAEYNSDGKYWEKKEINENKFLPNNLFSIPQEIKKLKNLKKLIIGGDWKEKDNWKRWRIKDITHVFSLLKLEYLNASNNEIEKFPIQKKLEHLKVLHLNNNRLHTCYTFSRFPNLEELYLSNNELKTVKFLEKSFTLKTIDLHRNHITKLNPLINLLKNTEVDISDSKWLKNTINIENNPLKEPNYETIHTGKEAVLRYFESEWKTVVNKELKLVLVGNSEVGKTTLVKYLDGEKDLDKIHEATHWMIEKDISSKEIINKIGEKCNIRIFDFGGQDYYHDTHHIFFTKNTIYFLLWEDKTNNLKSRKILQQVNGKQKEIETQDYPVEYWLESIKHFIKEKSNIVINSTISYEYDSCVLAIQNKVPTAENIRHLNNLFLTDERNYPFIYDFINIDILNGRRNLKHFDFLLSEIIGNMKIVGSDILEYQHTIRYKLNDYNEKKVLNFTEFLTYCNQNLSKNISEDEAKDLCSYLKQLGLIFYLPDFSKIYLDKKWVFKSIYKILDGLFDLCGEFDKKYISMQLGLDIDDELITGLILLMEELKIIFHHPTLQDKYIAPLYLPNEPLEGVGLFLLENRIPYRRFEYNGFIHKTFILDFFNRYGQKTIGDEKKFYYWKNGLIIKDDKTEQILHIKFKKGKNNEEEKRNACIDIYKLNDVDKENIFVSEVINYIKEINNNFFKLDINNKNIIIEDYYEEMVTLNNVDFVSLKLLNENAEKKKFIFNARKIERKNIAQEKFKKDINLVDYKQFLTNKNIMKKIFISYSKDDLDLVMSFINSLQSLVIDGIINQPWFCTYLQPGDEVHNKIREKMAEADIVCFMCSNNFFKTKYIVEYELKPTLLKYNDDKKQIILPIIIDRCRWILDNKEINLGKFSGFPYRGKPVISFYNWNDAWYVTNYFLEKVIKKKLSNDEDLFDNFGDLPSDVTELLKLQASGNLNK